MDNASEQQNRHRDLIRDRKGIRTVVWPAGVAILSSTPGRGQDRSCPPRAVQGFLTPVFPQRSPQTTPLPPSSVIVYPLLQETWRPPPGLPGGPAPALGLRRSPWGPGPAFTLLRSPVPAAPLRWPQPCLCGSATQGPAQHAAGTP